MYFQKNFISYKKKRCNASDGKRDELRHGAWLVGFSHGWLAENATENEAPVACIGGGRCAWARVDLGDTRPLPSNPMRRLYALLSGTGADLLYLSGTVQGGSDKSGIFFVIL